MDEDKSPLYRVEGKKDKKVDVTMPITTPGDLKPTGGQLVKILDQGLFFKNGIKEASDQMAVTFPPDLDVTKKALLVGLAFAVNGLC